MHLQTLLQNLATVETEQNRAISGITADSRLVQKGDLFLAYPGFRVDGRKFIEQAISQGAAAVVCEAAGYQLKAGENIPIISVPNLQSHLGDIAARFYQDPSQAMTIVGVTGTNGKTSITHFIAAALQAQHIICGVMGTLGYGFLPDLMPSPQTTLDPIQIQKIFSQLRAEQAKVIAMEVTSHALDQKRVQGVHFKIAVFTQLSRDHLDYHHDMQSYARAKELLFQQPGLRYGVVNLDDELGQQIVDRYHQRLTLIGYSQLGKTDARIACITATAITPQAPGFHAQLQTPWGNGELTTALLGRFNISNLLAVLAVLCLLDMPLTTALATLSQLSTVKGRMQCLGGQRQPLVVVDYSHTPDALEKALTALREHCHGKLICVFGCGGDRDRGKRPQMAAIAERYADQVILTNDNPRSESPQAIINEIKTGFTKLKTVTVELDRKKAIQFAVQNAKVGDIVLVAGKGHETKQIIGDLVLPFDDVEEVKQALGKQESGK